MIIIPGVPKPKSRPRFNTKTGKAFNKDRKEDLTLSFIVQSQWNSDPLDVPVLLDVTFFMPIPKSFSKKKQNELDGKYYEKKIDLDNLIKKLDYLNGIVFVDDAKVCTIAASKIYSFSPRTEIEVKPLIIKS